MAAQRPLRAAGLARGFALPAVRPIPPFLPRPPPAGANMSSARAASARSSSAAIAYGLPDVARHVIGCHLNQDTTVLMRADNVASNARQAPPRPPRCTRWSPPTGAACRTPRCRARQTLLATSYDAVYLKKRGFTVRVDDVASYIWWARPRRRRPRRGGGARAVGRPPRRPAGAAPRRPPRAPSCGTS